MKALGKIIFLDVSIETLTKRLIENKEQRPILRNIPNDEMQTYNENLMSFLKTFYEDYDIKVDADLINETTFVDLLKQYV